MTPKSTRSKELLDALDGLLTAKQYETWTLYHWRGCSYQTIAYMLNLDRSTVAQRLKRANQLVDRWSLQDACNGDLLLAAVPEGEAGDRAGEAVEADHRRGPRRAAA